MTFLSIYDDVIICRRYEHFDLQLIIIYYGRLIIQIKILINSANHYKYNLCYQ